MIVCPRCSKENQSHYKFCLGCGAELPRDNAQPKSFTAPTPPAGVPAAMAPAAAAAPAAAPAAARAGAAPAAGQQTAAARPAAVARGAGGAGGGGGAAAGAAVARPAPAAAPARTPSASARPAAAAPAAAPAAGGDMVPCPSCGSSVPRNFKFCGSCGHDMTAGPAAPAARQAPAAAAPVSTAQEGRLVLIRPDGSEGDSFPLRGETIVGRSAAGPFASDSYMSPQHATFRFTPQGLVVSDMNSLNGVYVRVLPEVPTELSDGTVFRIGQEIIRFERLAPVGQGPHGEELMGSPDPGYLGRIRLVIGKEVYGGSFCVPPEGMYLGRERGDIIFPDDGYVSGLHCRIHGEGGRIFLTDAGSSNGTFVRLDADAVVVSGSLLLMGQQLFRVVY